MTDREDEMATEQLLSLCAEDQAELLAIRARLPRRVALLRRRGLLGRVISRETGIPEANVRYWTKDTEVGAA